MPIESAGHVNEIWTKPLAVTVPVAPLTGVAPIQSPFAEPMLSVTTVPAFGQLLLVMMTWVPAGPVAGFGELMVSDGPPPPPVRCDDAALTVLPTESVARHNSAKSVAMTANPL